MNRSRLLVLAFAAALLAAAVSGCSSKSGDQGATTTSKPASSAQAPVLAGSSVDETVTLSAGSGPSIHEFSSADDSDWLALPGVAGESLATTNTVSIKMRFWDSTMNEIASDELKLGSDGWQQGVQTLDERTAYISVSPLGADTDGAYSVQILAAD